VLRTSDGGATWVTTSAPSGLLGAQRVSLAFVSATHGFLGKARTTSGGATLWETTDGGGRWTPCAIAEESAGVSSIVALGAARVLATGASMPAGETLTSARIWCGELGSGATIAPTAAAGKKSTAGKTSKAAAKKKVAAKKRALKKAKKRARR
jgi:hypothetical protein